MRRLTGESEIDMKKVIAAAFLMIVTNSYAGQTAITDTGESVILNANGTWTYAGDNRPNANQPTATNNENFVKPSDSTFLLKSSKNNAAFWLNPAVWSFKKSTTTGAREYDFSLKGKDLYGMAITEEIQIPIETLSEAALGNAKGVAPDARITKKEYRNVNGKKLLYMEMNATLKGIPFTYLGYYFSDPTGSTQLVTFTASSLVPKYRSDVENFLNGLTFR